MKTINKVILSPADRNCSGSRCVNKVEVLSYGRPQGSGRQSGFTLVELLVVVLIIGILSAVAIPMYQGAVDKSHWSTMLPASKAIKDAEEAFKMTNGEYSDTMEHLDVQMNNSDLTFDLITPNNMSEPNVIRVTNSKLDNVRLASYLDDSPLFAGQLHCEAKNEGSAPNERAQRLCEKLLGGQQLTYLGDYNGYLLNQNVNQSLCQNANGSWSQSKGTCYKDHQSRCVALGSNYLGDGQCGYNNTNDVTITEGVCVATATYGCGHVEINEGGKCIANSHNSCSGKGGITINSGGECIANSGWSCGGTGSIVKEGGTCIANGSYGCWGVTFDGGKCIAKNERSCGYDTGDSVDLSTYINGGCCEEGIPGKTYCPDYAPKC